MIKRLLEKRIRNDLFKGKVIIVYGARRVGKTTLSKQLLSEFSMAGKYLNCEILSVEKNLTEREPEKLRAFLGTNKVIVLDEAQVIPDIGKVLKLINDTIKDVQIIATGSSSFDMAYKTSETLTGRAYHYVMYPLSVLELTAENDWMYLASNLERLLLFGLYPQVFLSDNEEAVRELEEISSSYLFKDLLHYDGIKKSRLLKDLLISLALQLGSEVSYNELANKLGVNSMTIQKYIDLLEQCHIIFRLNSFSRNLRKELSKSFKVYFYDNGIRNALINNYNPLSMRNDAGALWENFCISERIKSNNYLGRKVNSYFWRTYDQKEIDYIEETGGKITGYELKYSEAKKKLSFKEFSDTYKAKVNVVNLLNYREFFEGAI